jgi:anion-transporting  ArsA/GET3 family ATPase
VTWEELFDRDVLLVSGKGGTGKTTVAAALSAAAAAGGRRVLLAEVEGRAQLARALDVPDPGFVERPTSFGFSILSITPKEALSEYLRLFGLERVARPVLRSGVADEVIDTAPGFRDLLVCGKLYEITGHRRTRPDGRRLYDLVVVDAPPTGQIASFLSAPAGYADLAHAGRLRRQAELADRMLRTRSQLVLVTTLQEMAVAETLEAVQALGATRVHVAGVVANRVTHEVFPRGTRRARSELDPPTLVRLAGSAGLRIDRATGVVLLEEADQAHRRTREDGRYLDRLREAASVRSLPDVLAEGADVVRALAATVRPVPDPDGGPADAIASDRPARVTAEPDEDPAPTTADLDTLLGEARIVVVCGSGGVGKTTVSAAIGVHRAAERDTALLTVDPARRLATALGLPASTGDRTRVKVGRGRSLLAVQLDTQRTFDELVARYAPTAQARDRVLGNRFYRRMADSLSGTNEFMAMERLFELATEEHHDAVVVDTPPTRSALAFLDAPTRLSAFLGGRMLRLLLRPTARAGRWTLGVARLGATAFTRTAGRLVGAQALGEVLDFLSAFEGLFAGFQDRAERVRDLLGSEECAFLVVAAPTRPSLEEAARFAQRLAAANLRLAGVVVNRWHADAEPLPPEAEDAVTRLSSGSPAERAAAAVLGYRLRIEPRRAAETRAVSDFRRRHPNIPIVAVPELPVDVHDVAGLRLLGRSLFGGAEWGPG